MGKKEDEIKDYFKRNGGEHLQKLERGLVEFSELYEESSYKMETLEELLSINFVPHLINKEDLMCFNKDDNALVIVEIKSPSIRAKHETLGQILCYIFREKNYIATKKAFNQKVKHINGQEVEKVRGIILAHESRISKSLKQLIDEYKNINKYVNVLPEISLKKYRLTPEREIDVFIY